MKLCQVTLISGLLPLAWTALTTKSVLEACLTEYCTESPAAGGLPTKTTTYTLTQVGTVTSSPTTTFTPQASTVTVKSTIVVTSTKTVGPVNTLTSTSTVLSTSQATVTDSVTITVPPVVSVTVSGSTTTVPTSPGQVFQSDSPYDSYPPSDTRRRDLEHEVAHPHFPRNNQWPTTSSESPHYPTAVTCGLLVDIYGFNTVTASKTATVKAPAPTSKVTSTVTGTITKTACDAKVTSTVTTTSVIVVTTTATASVTVTTGSPTTVEEPESTFYAACVPDNIMYYDESGPGYILGYNIGNGDNYANVTTATAYDCCVACQTNGDCGGALFFETVTECIIDLPNGACDPNYGMGLIFDTVDWETLSAVIAGPCGQGAFSGTYINL